MTECINGDSITKEFVFNADDSTKIKKELKYKQEFIISSLISEVRNLRNKIDSIERINNLSIQEDSLAKVWDNEYDERWDNC